MYFESCTQEKKGVGGWGGGYISAECDSVALEVCAKQKKTKQHKQICSREQTEIWLPVKQAAV